MLALFLILLVLAMLYLQWQYPVIRRANPKLYARGYDVMATAFQNQDIKTIRTLYAQADNASDFNDFDRGILDAYWDLNGDKL